MDFRYGEIIRRLKRFGFEFDRQVAGSHEICNLHPAFFKAKICKSAFWSSVETLA